MVVERSDVKRRRKDAQDPLEGSPKRTKVHAQRKFAQGSGVNSPAMTPVKEKVKMNGVVSPPELLPAKRPNTEDFLTFLCFRGTKSLPPRLNFFNVAYKPEKQEKEASSSPGTSKSPSNTASETQEESPKPKHVPQVKLKIKHTPAVQALKKKYREQRLAKNKPSITELARKVKGKNMIRTRSKVLLEERTKKQKSQVEAIPVPKPQVTKVKSSHSVIVKRLGGNRMRAGLRSSGKLPAGSDIGIKTERKPRVAIPTKQPPGRPQVRKFTRPSATSKIDKNEEKSSDNDEPLPKKSCTISTRSTRGIIRRFIPPSSLPNLKTRPTRKTKEAAAIYMEMLTKDLRSPDDDFEDDSMSIESFPELPSPKKCGGQTDQKAKDTKEQIQKGKNAKQTKTPKSSSKERKEDILKPKEEEKEKFSSKSGNKASKSGNTVKTRNSAGKKSLDRSITKQEESRIVVETRSTRKSVGKVREVSPPQRVLRTKRNRVSLAEDQGETDEDEMFDESEEEEIPEPKKQLPKRNRPQRRSIKPDIETDEDSDLEVPVKKGALSTRSRAVEKKIERKSDRGIEAVETPKEIKGNKKETKDKKDDSAKQEKKTPGKGDAKVGENTSDKEMKKDEAKRAKTVRTRRSDVKVKQEEETPEKHLAVKTEAKPSQKKQPKKEIFKSEEESTDKEKDEKEDRKVVSGSKGAPKKESVKAEKGKSQMKKESSFDETSASEVDEPPPKIVPKSRASVAKKSASNSSINDNTKQEKKAKVSEDVVVSHCEVILQSLDKVPKVLTSEQEAVSSSNNNNISQMNTQKNKDSVPVGATSQKSPGQKASRSCQKKRQQSAELSEDSNVTEDSIPKRKGDSKSKKCTEGLNLKTEVVAREKREEPPKNREENKLPTENFSKELLIVLPKEIVPQKSEPNRQILKVPSVPHPMDKEGVKSESKVTSVLPVRTAEVQHDIKTGPKLDVARSDQKMGSLLKEKPVKGVSKPLETFPNEMNRELIHKFNLSGLQKISSPLNLQGKQELLGTFPTQNEIAAKEKPSPKEELHVDTNLPSLEKSVNQEKYEFCGDTLLMNLQGKLNNIPKAKEANGVDSQSDKTIKQNNTDSAKVKPSIGDTWRQAFKNAKIPKPGQLSPVPRSVKPFVRKPYSSQTFMKHSQVIKSALQDSDTKSSDDQSKESSVKSSSTSMVFPLRRYFPRDDPSKDQDLDRRTEKAAKTLTQLQFERRTSELVSGLRETPYVDNFLPVSTKPVANSGKKETPPKGNGSEVKPKEETPNPPAVKPTSEGKHLNLPLAVEHTLRKSSSSTVSKKPIPNIRYQIPQEMKDLVAKNIYMPVGVTPMKPNPSKPLDYVHKCFEKELTSNELLVNKPTDVDLMMKKKVNMTTEEINRWLDDSTSSGIEHTKDCGIFERNQCECSFRTSGSSMEGSSIGVSHSVPTTEDVKVGKSVVEPPVQLKELDTDPKFCTETISTCKVEEYKEKILSKSSSQSEITSEKLAVEPKTEKPVPSPVPKLKKPAEKQQSEKVFKSPKSMTEEEMCEFDFRFERNPNSPGESGSEMSSPTPRDDFSSSNEESPEKLGHTEHRKSIFHQKRNTAKRYPLSKSPCAFSPENESSVYAFEPDLPSKAKPFRRRGKSGESPASSSIAVQVNLETEAVLECSTQTERDAEEEGHLFYIPLQQSPEAGVPPHSALIQGVAVKLDTEGPDQRVIMRAKLVTKPATAVTQTTRSLVNNPSGGRTPPQKPEQKVRPLGSGSGGKPPPVGTVQPTVREPKRTDQATGTNEERPLQTTQATQSTPIVKAKEPLPPPPPPPPSRPIKRYHKAKATEDCTMPPTSKRDKMTYLTNTMGQLENGNKTRLSRKKPDVCRQSVDVISKTKPQPIVLGSTEFPAKGSQPCLVEAPTFHPTEKEFQDPLEYIDKITPQAQQFGICRIVPPSNFKPECKVSDDMRFTAYNQYIHKMLHRWGPNVKEMSAIRKYLATQSIALAQPPWIGGMEVDLPRLYQTVQTWGGLKEVIEKKRWTKVADTMKIPKSAQDRVTKLDDIYCKFLLPYDTLSHEERNKLLEEVEEEWRERERKAEQEDSNSNDSESESDDNRDECITKGRSMALNAFYRIARNTMAMWFKGTPVPTDVEAEFWKHVSTGQSHVCVHSGSIDSGTWGYGFPTVKSSSTSRHPWNLKVLTNNSGSILRSIGPLMGVTVPTLHVGMLFSACCWYRDPHALPWIEYLHTGASKIWYGVPDDWSSELRLALKSLLPRYVRDKPIWLASDTAMVPPGLLVDRGVALSRLTQDPGQFVLVFPRAFTSSVSTGYLVSESVYFARPSWLDSAEQVFKDVQESCEPTMFSLEKLLFCIATDVRSSVDVLNQVLPMVVSIRESEVRKRRELERLGLVGTERLPVTKGRRTKVQEEQDDYECESCRSNLFLSLVANSHEEANYCLTHAIELLTKDLSQLKYCKLLYGYDEEEMEELIDKVKSRIEMKSQKKPHNKNTGGGNSSKC